MALRVVVTTLARSAPCDSECQSWMTEWHRCRIAVASSTLCMCVCVCLFAITHRLYGSVLTTAMFGLATSQFLAQHDNKAEGGGGVKRAAHACVDT